MEYCGPKEGTKEWFEDYYGIPEEPKKPKSKWACGMAMGAITVLCGILLGRRIK